MNWIYGLPRVKVWCHESKGSQQKTKLMKPTSFKKNDRGFNWKVREGYRAPICFLVDGGGYQFHVMSCSAFSAAIRPAVYLSVVVDLWTQEDQKVEVQHRTSHCGLSDLIGWCCGTTSLLICNHRYILKASCVWLIFFLWHKSALVGFNSCENC